MNTCEVNPLVEAFFDTVSGTVSYVVFDTEGGHAAIIDSVLDADVDTQQHHTIHADRLIAFVRSRRLTVEWILETHVHVDHFSAANYLQGMLGGRRAIGARVRDIQTTFKELLRLDKNFRTDGSQFDHLFEPNETFRIGELTCEVMFVPGHTPADIAYRIGDAIFVGDTVFMPDLGTARCDFPGGHPALLYESIQRLLSLPPHTRLFACHDYPPEHRGPRWQSSVAEHIENNIHVRAGITRAEFIELRQSRDSTLAMPALYPHSIRANIQAPPK